MARSQKVSAGLMMCRLAADGRVQVLLAHPGGPYFAKKDAGSWTVPKGLVEDDDTDLLEAAKREFTEETGVAATADVFHPLGTVAQKNGKIVHAWAFAGDMDPATLRSNTFEIEWPPRSGRTQVFPEIDRAEFFDPRAAVDKIIAAQRPFVEAACAAEARAALFPRAGER